MRYFYLCLTVVFVQFQAHGQMKLVDNSITQLIEFETSLSSSYEDSNNNLISPLGSNAMKLFQLSYKKQNEASATGGLWIEEEELTYQYKSGRLWLNGKILQEVESKNLKKIFSYLVTLENESDYAKNIIRTLQNSYNSFTIKISTCNYSYMVVPINKNKKGILNNNAYAFQIMDTEELVVDYAGYDQIGSSAEIRWNPKDNLVKVAHELGHAYDANFGLMDDRTILLDGQAILSREVRAIYHENMIRKDLNLNLRESIQNTRMMIVDGEPITYPLPPIARN